MSANQSQDHRFNALRGMSGLGTAPFLTIDFDCRTCKTTCWIDQECIDTYKCDGLSLDTMDPIEGIPTRCSACVRIIQAVQKLEGLVVRKPYLLTGGMAAAPEKEAWETDPDEKTFEYGSDEESHGDERDKEEREAFLEQMTQSFTATAGQGFTEHELYAEDAAENGRQSQASTQVEEDGSTEWEGETDAGDEETCMAMDSKQV